MLFTRRDGRVAAFTETGTDTSGMFLRPAWMIVSSVYVYWLKTHRRRAASRCMARNPLGASGMLVPLAKRTTMLPRRCNDFLIGEKSSIPEIGRAPMTICADPSRKIGRAHV